MAMDLEGTDGRERGEVTCLVKIFLVVEDKTICTNEAWFIVVSFGGEGLYSVRMELESNWWSQMSSGFVLFWQDMVI